MTSPRTAESEQALKDQRALVEALRSPRCYAHPVDQVEVLETHISTILLAGDYAYKLKKPLKLDFLDFSTLQLRRHFCQEELRINRSRAAWIYLECVAITGEPESPLVAGDGPALEYAVKMRRFPEEARLDHLLDAGALDGQDMEALGEELAALHRAAPPATPPWTSAARQCTPVADNLRELQQLAGNDAGLPPLRDWCVRQLRLHRRLMGQRGCAGAVRECHGDLHLANLVRLEGRFLAFDGIEFSEALRWIDVLNDLAFLLMDLHAHERPDLAARLLSAYLDASGDHAGLPLLPLYLCYRALVRAKINAIRLGQLPPDGDARAEAEATLSRYLRLASSLARRPAPRLWITAGLSGSGKSTVALDIVQRHGAIRLRSDVERKRLFGLGSRARTHSAAGQGIYSPDAGKRTYAHLQQLAQQLLEAGWPVIVDAANLKRSERDAFRQLATKAGVTCTVLWCEADPAELRERIRRRNEQGLDPSEADESILESQLGWYEPPDADETDVARIDTGSRDCGSTD
ncbi:MAG: AAA family ATPase [Ectothiorhodospiraceae bacterium]|nr:AAA family ATPase [Ectothiorhodospiraceae bacterium]MCH8505501.1 AAA family ATPase [Ectothiorhodospiraceae bacterium]